MQMKEIFVFESAVVDFWGQLHGTEVDFLKRQVSKLKIKNLKIEFIYKF
jgi:hypothetical protein